MFSIGYAVCRTLNEPDRPAVTDMEIESRMFLAEARKLERLARKPLLERVGDAALSLVPSRVRNTWTERALERDFAAQCARLKDLSPHLLDDIGVEEVIEEAVIDVPKIGTVPLTVPAATMRRQPRSFRFPSHGWATGAQPA